ncbi:hypothetical protein RhiirA4_470155 [Rhizophagus irregularis]|uniref:Uncharacterized protein n=1 Tax=Rhizophagus irregularis TaxID=588596 RepID=A0A2I1H0T6_9GLOM|nr:hypothetical protein RhiirA4_470155 [Rhizophagus irregularis]
MARDRAFYADQLKKKLMPSALKNEKCKGSSLKPPWCRIYQSYQRTNLSQRNTPNYGLMPVRTPKQIERWNRLTKSVFKTEHHFNMTKPYILNPTTKCTHNLVVFKQIHVPKKFICPYSMMFSPFPRSQEEIKNRQREKCHEKN